MAAQSNTSAGNPPKLLRATNLAGGESLLRETRATGWFYFPGPVFVLLVLAVFDYAAIAVRFGWGGIPWLTSGMGGLPTVAGSGPGSYLVIFFLFLTLVAVLWLLVRYLRWITTVYAVTTHRVIIQRGLFSRDFEEIPIPQVHGCDVHQRIIQRLFGYGTVKISSEAGTTAIGNEEWHGIPHPFEFQRLVEAANQNLTRGAVPPMGWNQNPPNRSTL